MSEIFTKQNKTLHAINLILISAILVYGFSYFFLGAFYSHPNAEDFSLSANAKNFGIFYSVKEVLVNYDGRYFTNILHAVNPLAFGCISCYKWVNVFSIVFPVFSLYFLIRSFYTNSSKLIVLLGSTLFVLINYAISPSIAHQVYWMVSSFVYHYPWCFYLLWMGSFIRSIKSHEIKSKNRWLGICSILLVCSMGMNEMFLVINSVSLLGVYIYLRKSESKGLQSFWPVLVSAIVSTLFFLSNPGISKRLLSFEEQNASSSLFDILLKSTIDFWKESIHFLSYGFLILPFLILLMIYYKNAALSEFQHKILYTILAFTAVLFSVLAFYLPMGFEDGIPIRIYTSIFFGFLLVLCFALCLLKNAKIFDILNRFSSFQKQIVSLVCLLTISVNLIMGEHNIALLKNDYHSGKMESLHQQYSKRYTLLQNASNDDSHCWKKTDLPTLKNTPTSIFHQPDIKANRSEAYWNKAYEKYFLIDEVRLEGDSISLLKVVQNQYMQ
jgi:hypothetical protein